MLVLCSACASAAGDDGAERTETQSDPLSLGQVVRMQNVSTGRCVQVGTTVRGPVALAPCSSGALAQRIEVQRYSETTLTGTGLLGQRLKLLGNGLFMAMWTNSSVAQVEYSSTHYGVGLWNTGTANPSPVKAYPSPCLADTGAASPVVQTCNGSAAQNWRFLTP